MTDLFKIAPVFHHFGRTNIKILMVVDGSIDTVESPGAFGIGRVARLIDELSRGCSSSRCTRPGVRLIFRRRRTTVTSV